MKIYTLIILIIMIMISVDCKNSKDNQIRDLQTQINTLQNEYKKVDEEKNQAVHEKEIFINEVTDITNKINQIQDRILSINRSSKTVVLKSKKDEIDSGSIFKELADIETKLEIDSKNVDQLMRKIEDSNIRISGLVKTVSLLRSQIIENENEIKMLRTELEKKENELQIAMEKQKQTEYVLENVEKKAKSQEEELNRKLYIIDSEKNLLRKGIIEKKGGFLGIGDNLVLSSKIDESLFDIIDISIISNIKLHTQARDVIIIPSRDPDSYKLIKSKKKIDNIEIINSQIFWNIKYLVVVCK